MEAKSVIIIGGGLAGLSAGLYTARNGFAPHIFEHHTRPGGVCATWERKGYVFDGCVQMLMGARPGHALRALYEEAGALESLTLEPIHHLQRLVDEQTGDALDITSDLDRLEQDVRAIEPRDQRTIASLLATARALRDLDVPLQSPREIPDVMGSLAQLWRLRRVIAFSIRCPIAVCDLVQRLHNPFLRWAFARVFVPEMPVALLAVFLGQLAGGQLMRPTVTGPSEKLVEGIMRRYLASGGRITLGSRVDRILVEQDRAVGIRLAGGVERSGDFVVSAADGRATIFEMLEGRYVDAAIRERYSTWPITRPIVQIHFGAATRFPTAPSTSLLALEHPLDSDGERASSLLVRLGVEHDGSPRTAVQASFETSFDRWAALYEDPVRYTAEKERVAGEVLARLERHLPGLAGAVEVTDVATPCTFYRYTRNHRGAFEGWLPSREMLRGQLPKTLPGLDGFYMAGQWVEPGGGIPPALFSGRNVARILCRRERRPFRSI
jgi:phytoene desaturase